MIDYFPLYNKFRAVSSIQVILELCVPVLAILALVQLLDSKEDTAKKLRHLKVTLFITLGIGVLLFLVKGMFSFAGQSDETYRQYYGDDIVSLIVADRKAVYNSDIFRSLIYVALAALVIWFHLKNKLKQNWVIVLLGALLVFDLVGVAKRYVNEDDFVAQRRMLEPFQETDMDKQIAQDTTVFRVYDPSEIGGGGRTAYFHQSIWGYHAAKPAGIQELFDFHISKNNVKVLSMLNVKYVVQQDGEGRNYPALNPDANGNAWFIDELVPVFNANDEIMALNTLDVKHKAVFDNSKFESIAALNFKTDSTATIKLVAYQPNHLTYSSNNSNPGMAVFSEMYYPHGWNAYIDGELKEHFRANYVLRALQIPAGKHKIEFKFEPSLIKVGGNITMASSIILVLVLFFGIGHAFWSVRKKPTA